jgi:hypothetical protein
MTGPYDDGPSGIFDHLDDPGAPAPNADVLASVVHRGRRIRARRQGAFAVTGAVAITVAVVAGLGISHAVNASRGHDTLVPAGTPTPVPSVSAHLKRHQEPGTSVLVPGAGPATGAASPSVTPSPVPCGTASPSDTTGSIIRGPFPQSSVPPLVPTAAPEPCASESPSPSPSPTPSETASPEPSATGEPSSSPGAQAPSEPPTR